MFCAFVSPTRLTIPRPISCAPAPASSWPRPSRARPRLTWPACDLKLPDGRERLVRLGHGPERLIQTSIGPVEVSRVKIRDRGATDDADRIRFTSAILPKWARRTKSLDALLPILYLRGLSTGDFQEALSALLGRDAPSQEHVTEGVRTSPH